MACPARPCNSPYAEMRSRFTSKPTSLSTCHITPALLPPSPCQHGARAARGHSLRSVSRAAQGEPSPKGSSGREELCLSFPWFPAHAHCRKGCVTHQSQQKWSDHPCLHSALRMPQSSHQNANADKMHTPTYKCLASFL